MVTKRSQSADINRKCARVCLLMALLLSNGCSTTHHHEDSSPKPGPTYMIYSPNGEPLNGSTLGRPSCKSALSSWFDRVDFNHDGFIDHDEFMLDASTQFTRMDLDRNGYLLSEELERYRLPYRQDINPVIIAPLPKSQDSPTDHHHGHHEGTTNASSTESTNQSGQLITPDPVMSADVNNDFRVTSQEFMTQAEKLFSSYDIDHNGFIKRETILKICKSKS